MRGKRQGQAELGPAPAELSFQSNGPHAHSVKQWDMGQHHDEAAECD